MACSCWGSSMPLFIYVRCTGVINSCALCAVSCAHERCVISSVYVYLTEHLSSDRRRGKWGMGESSLVLRRGMWNLYTSKSKSKKCRGVCGKVNVREGGEGCRVSRCVVCFGETACCPESRKIEYGIRHALIHGACGMRACVHIKLNHSGLGAYGHSLLGRQHEGQTRAHTHLGWSTSAGPQD
eukprot:scaffold11736_cov121-Isochrysis_galbana.AAC.1